MKLLRKNLFTETIDLDLFILGIVALIIRSLDMTLTYRSIMSFGAEEINLGLHFFFKAFGLKLGIFITQILSAIVVFTIVFLTQKARKYGLLLRYGLHVLIMFHIIGLLIIIYGLNIEFLLRTILVAPIILVLTILVIDLFRIFKGGL